MSKSDDDTPLCCNDCKQHHNQTYRYFEIDGNGEKVYAGYLCYSCRNTRINWYKKGINTV